ncbi:MAG: hypothetical protein ACREPJ_01910 [Rhodanobacteraceae bacterium]
MTLGCGLEPGNPNTKHDLTHGASALLFWCLPIAMLIAGGEWPPGMGWLWTAAFALAGTGYLLNATRCGRTHCYVTGPLFVLAALWSLLSAVGLAPLHPNKLMWVVVGVVVLAYLSEFPLGRYAGAGRAARHG